MATFVLEIGSEELPSRFLAPEEAELRARFSAALDEAGLEYGAVRVMSTRAGQWRWWRISIPCSGKRKK